MPATESTQYSSPPFILDLEMSENPEDLDFDFFNSSVPFPSTASPASFLNQEFGLNDRRNTVVLGSPAAETPKINPASRSQYLDSRQAFSARSSGSPAGSFQDSSSDSSRYKRKSSSDSSQSALTGKDLTMVDADMGDWKVDEMMTGGDGTYGAFDGTIDPANMTTAFGFSDKSMENDFDFDSAASSPNHFGMGPIDMESPEMPTIKYGTPRKNSPKLKNKFGQHVKVNSQHSITQSMLGLTTNGSREASPLSAMITSQESSPTAFFNSSPSPNTGIEYVSGPMLSTVGHGHPWQGGYDFTMANTHIQSGLTPPSLVNNLPSPISSGLSLMDSTFKPTLTIHPTPLKSRVETQIPIKMTLFPIPPGVTKLHLPTHTISKPKLLSKPPPERSPDTLELYTTLVCTSAMQNPEQRRRAFARAAMAPQSPESNSPDTAEGASDEDDENKPLNGGEVRICVGCVTRERKRAARKKIKKVEEEESWHKDENRRVIVFNTHEVKEWQQPSVQVPTEATGDRREPLVPEGAMQVDAPMRIACYCRHQNEKLGFQVIFTIKDCNDRLIAQEITSSIMITDDHKTHNLPQLSTQTSHGSDGQMYHSSGMFAPDTTFELPMAPFRLSHSSSDLQTLQRNFAPTYPSGMTSSQPSQATSATMTPRNLSRQASPTGSIGPSTKKRKASGSGKVPTGLAMTKLENAPPSSVQSTIPGSTSSSAAPSPFTAALNAFQSPQEATYGQLSTSVPQMPPQFHTGPPTPNSNDQVFFSNANRSHSLENLAMHQLYSAPTSTHPSRAPSPTGLRNNAQVYQQQQQQQQAHIAQAVANSLYGMPLALNPLRPPTIHKMIPSEGPKAGGIEVTCLGSGFCQGLEVMFGDAKATTTTYWGETSLVCLLPPATFAGTVPVTFKHQHQQQPIQTYAAPTVPKQQAFFKYVDDDEQQIIRTALSVLGHKMTGKMEDVRDLARRIVGDGSSSWGGSANQTTSGGVQGSNFSAATFGINVEATLLKCLDLIDLDDSLNMPRLNLRRSSGQTMLHLACSLGLHRFVAALLARGANPEPRDKGGYTPMHFAAMHNHPQIVRRLILSGADPTLRTLQGYTPSDLATSKEVLRATRRIEHHSRNRSGESIRSRTSSATSLRSLWEPAQSVPASGGPVRHEDTSSDSYESEEYSDEEEGEQEYEEEDADTAADGTFWMQSRGRSTKEPIIESSILETPNTIPTITFGNVGGLALPSAAMNAFRDQVTAQIQHLQNTMHLSLPQMPDYQAYLPATSPMVRRISSLVPNMGTRNTDNTDSKWWDLFSGPAVGAPPAYDEIFPDTSLEVKRSSAEQAAADAVADNKCAELFDQTETTTTVTTSSSSNAQPSLLENLKLGRKLTLTQDEADQLRLAHAEKVKKLRSDRNLFFIWIPLLIFIVLAMLYNRVPQVWAEANRLFDSFANRNIIEV